MKFLWRCNYVSSGRQKKSILRGKEIKLGREDVLKILSEFKEEPLPPKGQASNYYVVVEGKPFPVKKALYFLLERLGYDFTLLDFVTQDAVRIFRALGFNL